MCQHVQAAKKHRNMCRTMSCNLKFFSSHKKKKKKLNFPTFTSTSFAREGTQGMGMEWGHLMEIFIQAVTFLFVSVSLDMLF